MLWSKDLNEEGRWFAWEHQYLLFWLAVIFCASKEYMQCDEWVCMNYQPQLSVLPPMFTLLFKEPDWNVLCAMLNATLQAWYGDYTHIQSSTQFYLYIKSSKRLLHCSRTGSLMSKPETSLARQNSLILGRNLERLNKKPILFWLILDSGIINQSFLLICICITHWDAGINSDLRKCLLIFRSTSLQCSRT